jgi:hypothetical protein
VHQATTVVSVRDASGRVIVRCVLATEAAALLDFFGLIRGEVHVAFEEGTQAQWLYDLLVPVVQRVVATDRRGESRRGNKADQIDADELSRLLRSGDLRPVYHGGGERATLRELTRTYGGVVDDSTRVMLRLRALFRARAIGTRGTRLFSATWREEWLSRLSDRGGRFRAQILFAELDGLRELRPQAKAAMVAEARRDPAWEILRSVPYLGPVRVSMLLATMQTPWRFRTKRNLWGYAGLAVVSHTSAEHHFVEGKVQRRRRRPLTRGLNRNHNRTLKDIFKGAAVAATGRAGPLQDFYHGMIERGMRPEMARVTLARKIAAVTLRLWKRGEHYDPTKLSMQVT